MKDDVQESSESENTANSDKGAVPTVQGQRSIRWYGKWSIWDRIVKVGAAVGTVGALLAIVCQVSQTSEQIDAMWYSTRPSLYIQPMSGDQLSESHDYDVFFASPDAPQTDVYQMYYVLENAGSSPAVLDSVTLDIVSGRYHVRFEKDSEGLILPSGKTISEPLVLHFQPNDATSFRVRYTYAWDLADKREERYVYHKAYLVEGKSPDFVFRVITPDDFEARLAAASETREEDLDSLNAASTGS